MPVHPLRTPRLRFRLRALNDSRVNGLSGTAYGLEIELIAGDFNQHEGIVLVESLGGQSGFSQITLPQLGAATLGKMINSLLRLEPLVEVLVPGKDHRHVVLQEYRFKDLPQLDGGPMLFTG